MAQPIYELRRFEIPQGIINKTIQGLFNIYYDQYKNSNDSNDDENLLPFYSWLEGKGVEPNASKLYSTIKSNSKDDFEISVILSYLKEKYDGTDSSASTSDSTETSDPTSDDTETSDPTSDDEDEGETDQTPVNYLTSIKNYGDNSYMISVLQGLFHTPGFLSAFNKVVERIMERIRSSETLTPYQKNSSIFIHCLLDLHRYIRSGVSKIIKGNTIDTGAELMNRIRSINPLLPIKYLLTEEGDPYEFGLDLLHAIGCVDAMFTDSYTDDEANFEGIFYGRDNSDFRKSYSVTEHATDSGIEFYFTKNEIQQSEYNVYSEIRKKDNKYISINNRIVYGEYANKSLVVFTSNDSKPIHLCKRNEFNKCYSKNWGKYIYIYSKSHTNDPGVITITDNSDYKSIVHVDSSTNQEEYNTDIIIYSIQVLFGQIDRLQKTPIDKIDGLTDDIKTNKLKDLNKQKKKWENIFEKWKKENIKDIDIAYDIIKEIEDETPLVTDGIDSQVNSNVEVLTKNIKDSDGDKYDKYVKDTIVYLGPCFNKKKFKKSFDNQKSAINSLLNDFNKLTKELESANNLLSV